MKTPKEEEGKTWLRHYIKGNEATRSRGAEDYFNTGAMEHS